MTVRELMFILSGFKFNTRVFIQGGDRTFKLQWYDEEDGIIILVSEDLNKYFEQKGYNNG